MTERKPGGVSWQTWIDRQVEQAQARGEFDNLAGKGRRLADVDRPHDEMWWIRRKLRREEVQYLPPTLAIQKEREDALVEVAGATTEAGVRRIVATVNQRIRYVNAHAVSGPPSSTMPLDEEEVIDRWKASQPEPERLGDTAMMSPGPSGSTPPTRTRGGRWLRRRRVSRWRSAATAFAHGNELL